MNTHSTNKLIEILERKQIKFDSGEKALFRKYSYYQVVNAYKNIFVKDIDYIEDIKNNIENNHKIEFYRNSFKIKPEIKDEQLYEAICDKICEKYGLKANGLREKEEYIKQIKYHLHIYGDNIKYGDFVRMYKFEHELRLMLLKYTLIIEENMKNIFISYLNDNNAKADYLVNMDNYNTSSINNKSFETMKLIIGKYDNLKSKPIKRKRDQNIAVPYWIIINELAMNQTYYAMANLNEEIARGIFIRCVNFFTNLNITEELRGKNQDQIRKENSQINMFKTILCYLGEFRNMLAHNQPIYCYNIDSFEIKDKTELLFELPKTKKGKKNKRGRPISREQQQINLNAELMNKLSEYFGSDDFNSKNYTNLDLSKIIYILFKMLKNIDKNTKFYDELKGIFIKYNIILNVNKDIIVNVNECKELLKEIEKLNDVEIDNKNIIDRINKKQSYKSELNKEANEFRKIKKSIMAKAKKIKIETVKSKYKPFSQTKRYTQLTGIDYNFFNKIV